MRVKVARAALTAGLMFLVVWQVSLSGSGAQRRRPSVRKTRPPSKSDARKYSNFLHHTHGKDSQYPAARNLTCKSCHTIPLLTDPDRIADAKNPKIIRGYPYHDACFGCHAAQIYRGDRPTICTVCHTRVSPRATDRDVHAKFPKQDDMSLRQFPGYFPHKTHGPVIIAGLERQSDSISASHRFLVASFKVIAVSLSSLKKVSCADCHATDARPAPVMVLGGDEQPFTPAAGSFKTSPAAPAGHASCFAAGCHWDTEEPKPKTDDCAGCHLTPPAFAEKIRSQLSPVSPVWFKEWPRQWPRRISVKFRHETEDHKESCKTCHAVIAGSDFLQVPDVRIESCFRAGCHGGPTSRPSIIKEMNQEDEDIFEGRNNNSASTEGKHTCTGCHMSMIGGAPPPCTHYLLFGERYFSLEEYPKSAKQLGERCKK